MKLWFEQSVLTVLYYFWLLCSVLFADNTCMVDLCGKIEEA